jgi:hypothetical protein
MGEPILNAPSVVFGISLVSYVRLQVYARAAQPKERIFSKVRAEMASRPEPVGNQQ